MHKATTLSLNVALLASLVMLSPLALAADSAAAKVSVAGEKLDSGLARMPHFGQWVDNRGTTLVGQSLDDGLGDLPHYSKWVDATGKNPMAKTGVAFGAHEGAQAVLVSSRK